MEPNNNTMPMSSKEKSTGPLVGSIIIIVILIIGGIYLIGKSQLGKKAAPQQQPQPQQSQSVNTTNTSSTSSSADLNSIQNDLNQTSSGINSAGQGVQ